jgi:hypothetical protein
VSCLRRLIALYVLQRALYVSAPAPSRRCKKVLDQTRSQVVSGPKPFYIGVPNPNPNPHPNPCCQV